MQLQRDIDRRLEIDDVKERGVTARSMPKSVQRRPATVPAARRALPSAVMRALSAAKARPAGEAPVAVLSQPSPPPARRLGLPVVVLLLALAAAGLAIGTTPADEAAQRDAQAQAQAQAGR